MLYNESTGKPAVQSDAFLLESLIAWLEKQPARRNYIYDEPQYCLLAQYFISSGFPNVFVGGASVWLNGLVDGANKCSSLAGAVNFHEGRLLPESFAAISWGHPHTFGAALIRAKRFAR